MPRCVNQNEPLPACPQVASARGGWGWGICVGWFWQAQLQCGCRLSEPWSVYSLSPSLLMFTAFPLALLLCALGLVMVAVVFGALDHHSQILCSHGSWHSPQVLIL